AGGDGAASAASAAPPAAAPARAGAWLVVARAAAVQCPLITVEARRAGAHAGTHHRVGRRIANGDAHVTGGRSVQEVADGGATWRRVSTPVLQAGCRGC